MATKARVHWFWRGAIAVLAGVAVFVCLMAMTGKVYVHPVYDLIHDMVRMGGLSVELAEGLGMVVALGLPSLLTAVAVQSMLMRLYSRISDGELHCRRCNHILRGLSEPRCPECGEAI